MIITTQLISRSAATAVALISPVLHCLHHSPAAFSPRTLLVRNQNKDYRIGNVIYHGEIPTRLLIVRSVWESRCHALSFDTKLEQLFVNNHGETNLCRCS